MVSNSLVDAIGNTPLVRLDLKIPAKIYAKLEYLNPGGSIKDRSAAYLIAQAEKSGQLKLGGTLIDASSGNQGIATAMIGARKGYKVIICVAEKTSKEKHDKLKACSWGHVVVTFLLQQLNMQINCLIKPIILKDYSHETHTLPPTLSVDLLICR